MVEIYGIRIDEPIEEDVYKKLLLYVSEEKRKRIKRFHFIEDARRTLYGELLVRYLACDRLKTANSELVIDCNEFGKPFLKEYPSFHFNISHSGDWVVCAISEKEVGIDIEQIKPIDYNIARRFFSNIEYQNLMMQPKNLRVNYFYDLWTLKESYIKYIGKGLYLPLDKFNINLNENIVRIFPICHLLLYMFKIFIDSEYKLSVCSEENMIIYSVKIISINKIKERLMHGT